MKSRCEKWLFWQQVETMTLTRASLVTGHWSLTCRLHWINLTTNSDYYFFLKEQGWKKKRVKQYQELTDGWPFLDTFGTFNLMETHTELKTSIDTDCSCERLLQVQVSHVSFDMYNNGVKKCEFVCFFLFCCGCCWILFHFGPLLLWKLGLKSVFLMSFHPDSVGFFSYFYFQNVKVKTNVLNTCWVNFSGAVVYCPAYHWKVQCWMPNSNVSILKKCSKSL